MVTLLLAYANGANDNFKGVATLFGSHTTSYAQALTWATLTTLLGSMMAFILATRLVKIFSGKGLVPDAIISQPAFLIAVIVGAGLTVLLATQTGIPISTTHSLTGALVGGGLMAVGSEIHFHVLGKSFFLPLLTSPLLAVVFTAIVYMSFKGVRRLLPISKETCICVGQRYLPVGHLGVRSGQVIALSTLPQIDVKVDDIATCKAEAIDVYQGSFLGVSVQKILDGLHFLSAGLVCFARGLNDTPKIVGVCVAAGLFGFHWPIVMVALVMALGGVFSAKYVAHTVSHRITGVNHGQGLTANLVTASLVLFASHLGVPVSTTHVSCGALFGMGAVNGQAHWRVIGGILGAWVLTLPVAAILAGGTYFILERMVF